MTLPPGLSLKKLILVIIALIIVAQGDSIYSILNPASNISSNQTQHVTLYSTSWCGSCKKAKRFLSRNNIKYVEYDVEKSTEGRQQYQALGRRGVPVLVIDGEVIHGYNEYKMKKLLKL